MRAGTTVRTDPGGTGRIGATSLPFEQVTHAGIEQGTCHPRSAHVCANWAWPCGRFRPTRHAKVAVFVHSKFPVTAAERTANPGRVNNAIRSVGDIVANRARHRSVGSLPPSSGDAGFTAPGGTVVRASPFVWAPVAPVVRSRRRNCACRWRNPAPVCVKYCADAWPSIKTRIELPQLGRSRRSLHAAAEGRPGGESSDPGWGGHRPDRARSRRAHRDVVLGFDEPADYWPTPVFRRAHRPLRQPHRARRAAARRRAPRARD